MTTQFNGLMQVSTGEDPVAMLRRVTSMVTELVLLHVPVQVTVTLRHVESNGHSSPDSTEVTIVGSPLLTGNGDDLNGASPSERRKSYADLTAADLRQATVAHIKALARGDTAPTQKYFEDHRGVLPAVASIKNRLHCSWNDLVAAAGFTPRPSTGGRQYGRHEEPAPDPDATEHGTDLYGWDRLPADLRPVAHALDKGETTWDGLSVADRRGLVLHVVREMVPEDRKLSMATFTERRPEWMPVAPDLLDLFKMRWFDLVRSALR